MPLQTPEKNHLYSQNNLLELFSALLMETPEIPAEAIDPALFDDPAFEKLYRNIMDLRRLTAALGRGDLHHMATGRGFVLSGLKALQASLRHLTWQAERISQGDFTQQVDFLGDFSKAFNEMVTQLAQMTEQLQRLASIDPLTQVHNRLSFEQFIEVAFRNAQKDHTPLSILIFDIDFFKHVNDQYGHLVGDQLLIKISDTLNRQFRASDMFARCGGEEFIAVLPNTPLKIAKQIAQRALLAVSEQTLRIEDGDELKATVSIGVSELVEGDEVYSDLMERADSALYRAKRNGRNQFATA